MNETTLYRITMTTMAQAMLDATLSLQSDGEAWHHEVLALALERWGDSIRLELDPLRVPGITVELLARVVSERHDEIAQWTVPADDDLSFVSTRRDETESLTYAIARWMLARGQLIIDIPGADAMLQELESFDATLAASTARDAVADALGARVTMHGAGSWLDKLR